MFAIASRTPRKAGSTRGIGRSGRLIRAGITLEPEPRIELVAPILSLNRDLARRLRSRELAGLGDAAKAEAEPLITKEREPSSKSWQELVKTGKAEPWEAVRAESDARSQVTHDPRFEKIAAAHVVQAAAYDDETLDHVEQRRRRSNSFSIRMASPKLRALV